MAKFDESKVINALHKDKAEIGKKYYFNDSLYELKENVENKYVCCIGTLEKLVDDVNPFSKGSGTSWQFIYPYEEPPKQRMTNIQLMEWLAKGNGLCKNDDCDTVFISIVHNEYYLNEDELNEDVDENKVIRSWNSDKWVEPTLDIYERDCKNISK